MHNKWSTTMFLKLFYRKNSKILKTHLGMYLLGIYSRIYNQDDILLYITSKFKKQKKLISYFMYL